MAFESFVPPWEMPGVLRGIDHLFALSVDEPMHNWSMIAAEADASGCEVIRDVEQLRG